MESGVGVGAIRILWMWRGRRGVVFRSGWRLRGGLLRLVGRVSGNGEGLVVLSSCLSAILLLYVASGTGVLGWCTSLFDYGGDGVCVQAGLERDGIGSNGYMG